MPGRLPSKDIWAVYRTAVLKYPIRKTKADKMKRKKARVVIDF